MLGRDKRIALLMKTRTMTLIWVVERVESVALLLHEASELTSQERSNEAAFVNSASCGETVPTMFCYTNYIMGYTQCYISTLNNFAFNTLFSGRV